MSDDYRYLFTIMADEMGGGGREGDFVLWASRLLFSSTEVNFVDNISFPNAS